MMSPAVLVVDRVAVELLVLPEKAAAKPKLLAVLCGRYPEW